MMGWEEVAKEMDRRLVYVVGLRDCRLKGGSRMGLQSIQGMEISNVTFINAFGRRDDEMEKEAGCRQTISVKKMSAISSFGC